MTKQTKKGFTLIEVLLSIIIISVGTIFVLQAFGREITALGISYDNIKAVLLLENKMAEFERELEEKGTLAQVPVSGKFLVKDSKDFNWTLTSLPSQLAEDLIELRLACLWKSKGKTRNITLTTFVREAENE